MHADLEGSSLLCETETFEINGQPRDVPAVTLDELVSERNLPTPYLIKVDVQGGELEVLEGAQATLPHTDAVILETTLFGTFDGGPQFIDVLSYMARREFVVYDLFGQLYRPLDGALIQTDVVFVREQSEYRKHHHYATPEQRREQLGG